MSDASQAKQDYPSVPMALLELLDYTINKANRPHPKKGKRDRVINMLALTGCTIEASKDADITEYNIVLRPEDNELLVGCQVVYLFDVNEHFYRLYDK